MYCQAENRLLNIARLNSVGQQGICLGFRHNKTRRIAADFQAQTGYLVQNTQLLDMNYIVNLVYKCMDIISVIQNFI